MNKVVAIVKKDGKEQWRSHPVTQEIAAYAVAGYILKHQNQSVSWALKWGGWSVEYKQAD